MDRLEETINEILKTLPPKAINKFCEFDLYNGWVLSDQFEMLANYIEYQRDQKRLKQEVEEPVILEFNESFKELYSFLSTHFYSDVGADRSRLVVYEGERYNEGKHLERYYEVQKLNDQFHEKYNNLRIEISKINRVKKKSEITFEIRVFETDNKYYFKLDKHDPILVNKGDYKLISHFKNSLSEVNRKDLGLEGKKYNNSFTSSKGRINKKLKKINYTIEGSGPRGNSIYKVIKL
jgi:hypothetical protein